MADLLNERGLGTAQTEKNMSPEYFYAPQVPTSLLILVMGISSLAIVAGYDYMELEEPSELFRSASRVGSPSPSLISDSHAKRL